MDLIVLTGGPGAGKTAVLELARALFCEHVALLPEAASIVYGGGFWRLPSASARCAAQSAIYHVQRQSERLAAEERRWAVVLCDRGSLDGLAYWPRAEEEYWTALGTTAETEMRRYKAVIHLRCPTASMGYNLKNPLRLESAHEAAEIDARIARIWSDHPNYRQVESRPSFLDKATEAVSLLRELLPPCCRRDAVRARAFEGPSEVSVEGGLE